MGSVYLAEDTELQRSVALKVPKFSQSERPEVVDRFYREARAAATLQHRNICTLHDVGQTEGLHYLTMAYIEGRTLAELIRPDKPLPERQVAILVRKLALALDEAHRQGILHRDLKPSNILIDRHREPVIMDFGLAKRVGADEDHLTKAGKILGTAAFMSPEQVETPESIGPAADVYSLGVILYQLLTGRLPFDGPPASVIGQLLMKEPEPVESLRPEVSPQLAEICRKAMAKRVDERYASMAKLAADLAEYLQRASTGASLANRSTPDAALASFLQTVAEPIPTRPHEPSAQLFIGREKRVTLKVQRAIASIVRRPMVVLAAGGFAAAVVLLGLALAPLPREAIFPRTEDQIDPAAHHGGDSPRQVFHGESNWQRPVAPPLAAIAPFDAARARKHQQAWADYLRVPVEQEVALAGNVKLTMVLIPPGEFVMGSPAEERIRFLEEARAAGDRWTVDRIPAEGPQHRVRITRPYFLGKYEITQAQWEAVMGNNPSRFTDTPSLPVERVSWDHVQPFLAKLNEYGKAQRMKFALPTEAQWEYACRAGTTTPWHCGEDEAKLQEYAWFNGNSGGKPHSVGELLENAFGLHDMHGNVWEWCQDGYDEGYYGRSPLEDPSGVPQASHRVYRGGSWINGAGVCRSAIRGGIVPAYRISILGFRVALVPSGK